MDKVEGALEFHRKISYSLVALLAGDFVGLILFSLISQAWEQPPSYFMGVFSFTLYSSLFAWVVVGIPAAFLINTAFVARLKWFFAILIGALLGSVALLIIFMIYGQVLPGQAGGYGYFWMFATLVSTVAFGIYCALVRQAVRQQEKNSALTAKVEPLRILRPLTRVDINHPELDIYSSDWLKTLDPSDPRRSTNQLSRPPGSKPY